MISSIFSTFAEFRAGWKIGSKVNTDLRCQSQRHTSFECNVAGVKISESELVERDGE